MTDRYTGYKYKKTGEKIHEGDVLLIRHWRKHGIRPYDRISEEKVMLSEYDTEECRGGTVLHCGWNAGGRPLPDLACNEYLLSGNDYTALVGIKK